ncbi:hypothetical protein [Burkholderia sp. LMG 13014]|uniref:hypothetical protein n=1 Tax=Burkholderia sp. LMG 13014 TaxID=2709306 RepID=UPI0019667FA3|nr:hypothetical protein [Burkholderia sp. LMG 13014]
MDQQEQDKVLRASLRFAPVGTPIVEFATTDASQELLEAWNIGHPGCSLSLMQNDRVGKQG